MNNLIDITNSYNVIRQTLSHSPYKGDLAFQDSENLGPRVNALAKRKLKDFNVTGSPPKRLKLLEAYGSDPFSQRVIQEKIKSAITAGRNIAIIVYKDPTTGEHKYTIGKTSGPPGGPHAEIIAYDKLPLEVRQNPQCILVVYTERKPCRSGPNCQSKLKGVLNLDITQIFYSFPHTPDKTRQKDNEKVLQQCQNKFGIRIAGQQPNIAVKLNFGE